MIPVAGFLCHVAVIVNTGRLLKKLSFIKDIKIVQFFKIHFLTDEYEILIYPTKMRKEIQLVAYNFLIFVLQYILLFELIFSYFSTIKI